MVIFECAGAKRIHSRKVSGDTAIQVFPCPPLQVAEVRGILASYAGEHYEISRWAEWCGGSPRVAHAVGENLKRIPRDILKEPATVPIWDRYVVGYKR